MVTKTMWFLCFLLVFSTQILADFAILDKGTSERQPEVKHNSWYFVERSKGGGQLFVKLDTYQTRTVFTSTNDGVQIPTGSDEQFQDRFLALALSRVTELRRGSTSARPIVLDVHVMEEESSTVPTSSNSVNANSTEEELRSKNGRRVFVIFALMVCCIASWVVFVLQVIKLSKQLQRKQRRVKRLKKKKLQTEKNALVVPLLEHEGTEKRLMMSKK